MMKHNLDRNSLEKLYFGFIRPILEYGSVVWDNCTREQSDLIESVQYESARIVTGLRKGTSRDKLYGELGWDSLQIRRKKHKLILMFKALEGELPNYITNNIISYINIEPITTWLETPDSSPLPNAAPSHIRIAFFQLFWIYGTN